MGEWITDTVINLQSRGILRVEDGNHGEARPRPDEFVDDGVAFIRAADMADGAVLFDSASKINSRARERITKGIGKPGDILISHKGTVGRMARAPVNAPDFVCSPQTTFWRSTNKERLSQDFLYAYMRSPKFAQEFLVRSGETDMAGYVSLTSQRCLVLSIPPIELQRPIGALISTLDEKIKLNKQMNQTLEAMAKAIFKDWFVDFGPTRAKMEGRTPYLAPAIWSLFPECLDPAGNPEAWKRSSIYEVSDVIYGAPFSSKLFNTDRSGRPLIRIRDLAGEVPAIWTTEVHPKGYIVTSGDIVVGMDGEFRAHLWGGDDAWLNQRVCVFVPKKGVSRAFVLNSIAAPLAHIEATEIATTVIHLGKNDIDRFEVILPEGKVLDEYNRLCQPMYDRIVANKVEARILGATRDLLLPKLMSGEVRVSDAEKLLSEVL